MSDILLVARYGDWGSFHMEKKSFIIFNPFFCCSKRIWSFSALSKEELIFSNSGHRSIRLPKSQGWGSKSFAGERTKRNGVIPGIDKLLAKQWGECRFPSKLEMQGEKEKRVLSVGSWIWWVLLATSQHCCLENKEPGHVYGLLEPQSA